jgi:Na+-driven multidrug efflux pump
MGTKALAAFFVGRGETKIIPAVTLIFNLINIILDFLLIFGCRILPDGSFEIIPEHGVGILKFEAVGGVAREIVPSLGIIGAALATVISQFFSTFLLFILFLRKSYRERYATGRKALRLNLLKNCLKIGNPNAMNQLISLIALAVMTQVIIAKTSIEDAHAYGIVYTIFILFCFIIKGMSAGVRTICSNAFGAQNWGIIGQNMRSWIILSFIFSAIVSLGLVIYPDLLVGIFSEKMVKMDIHGIMRHMLLWVWITFALDIAATNLLNVLLALGDTRFPMRISTLSFILVADVPTYVGIVYFQYDIVRR